MGGSLGLAVFTSLSFTALHRYSTHHANSTDTQDQTAALSSHLTVAAAAVLIAGTIVAGVLFRPGPVKDHTS